MRHKVSGIIMFSNFVKVLLSDGGETAGIIGVCRLSRVSAAEERVVTDSITPPLSIQQRT